MLNKSKKKYWYVITVLTFIVLTASYLRYYNFDERGIFSGDGAVYAAGGMTIALSVNYFIKSYDTNISFSENMRILETYLSERGATRNITKSFGQIMIYGILFLIFGIHEYVPILFSSTLGVLTVIIVYLIGKNVAGTRAGLISASIMAVSCNNIFWSRAIGAIGTVTFLSALGLLIYVLSLKQQDNKKLILSSLIFGFALMVHYSALQLICIILLFELYLMKNFSIGNFKRIIMIAVLMLSFSIVSFLAFKLYYFILYTIQGYQENRDIVEIYSNVFYQFLTKNMIKSFSELIIQPKALLFREGILAVFLFIVGSIFSLRKVKQRDEDSKYYLLMLLVFILPFIVWSILSGLLGSPKGYQFGIPAFAVIAGLGGSLIINSFNKYLVNVRFSEIITISMILLIIIPGISKADSLIKLENGYKIAVNKTLDYINRNGGVITDQHGVVQARVAFYLALKYQNDPEKYGDIIILDNKRSDENKGDFLMVDYSHYLLNDPNLEIVKNCAPIIVVENTMGKMPLKHRHNQGTIQFTRYKHLYYNNENMDKILIYDLRKCGEYGNTSKQ